LGNLAHDRASVARAPSTAQPLRHRGEHKDHPRGLRSATDRACQQTTPTAAWRPASRGNPHGFEESELLEPREALRKAGVFVDRISLEAGAIKSLKDRAARGCKAHPAPGCRLAPSRADV